MQWLKLDVLRLIRQAGEAISISEHLVVEKGNGTELLACGLGICSPINCLQAAVPSKINNTERTIAHENS